jgi:hypothetical protein
MQLDRKADPAGVQPGHEEQEAWHRGAAQPVALTREARGHFRDILLVLDVDLPVVHPSRRAHQRFHRRHGVRAFPDAWVAASPAQTAGCPA